MFEWLVDGEESWKDGVCKVRDRELRDHMIWKNIGTVPLRVVLFLDQHAAPLPRSAPLSLRDPL